MPPLAGPQSLVGIPPIRFWLLVHSRPVDPVELGHAPLASPRAREPSVTVNVAALPKSLVEAEQFGVVKGAFTGAAADRAGMYREDDGGAHFLDEIGEMRTDLQWRLLRALESGLVRPVGGARGERASVRVVAATNFASAGNGESRSSRRQTPGG